VAARAGNSLECEGAIIRRRSLAGKSGCAHCWLNRRGARAQRHLGEGA